MGHGKRGRMKLSVPGFSISRTAGDDCKGWVLDLFPDDSGVVLQLTVRSPSGTHDNQHALDVSPDDAEVLASMLLSFAREARRFER